MLINLLGVRQIIIGINKMDCDTAGYSQSRYEVRLFQNVFKMQSKLIFANAAGGTRRNTINAVQSWLAQNSCAV